MFHPQGPTFWELAKQALSSTERGYDLLASKFDYTPFRTPDAILEVIAGQIGRDNSANSGLDICCGTGAAMRMLRPICSDRVVGIDFSQGMLEVGRERTEDAAGSASLEFVRGNALDLPFQNEFDVAVCCGALGHILMEDQPRFIKGVHRSLRAGGRFVSVTATEPSIWMRRYWACHVFNAAMRVRNALISPPFVMYYLNFCLPRVLTLLETQGFDVQLSSDVFPDRWRPLQLLIATRL